MDTCGAAAGNGETRKSPHAEQEPLTQTTAPPTKGPSGSHKRAALPGGRGRASRAPSPGEPQNTGKPDKITVSKLWELTQDL